MPLGVGVTREGRWVYANASLLGLLGRTAEQVLGQPFHRLTLLPLTCQTLADPRPLSSRDEGPCVYESSLLTPQGERRVEISVSPEGPERVVLVRDVSSRARYRAVLQRLAELGAGLPGLRTEQEVIHRVFMGLAELGFTFGYLVPQGELARLERVHVAPELAPAEEALAWAEDLTGAWSPLLERAWNEGSAYDAELALEISRFASQAPTDTVRARLREARLRVIGVRIDVGGRPRAVLAVAADWLREEELPPLRLFGAQVSAALEAALTISQLSAQNTALVALNRLASAAATATEPRAFFESGAQEIRRLLGCDALGLLLLSENGKSLEMVHADGLDASTVERYRRVPRHTTFSHLAMKKGEVLVVDRALGSSATRAYLQSLNLATVAVVPLRARSRMVGTLVVAFHQPREITPLERETLQAMGAHFAAATESHRLLNELRQRADDLVLIHEVGRNMVATLEMDLLMQIGVEGLALIANSPDAYLLMLDAEGQRLEYRASVHHHPELHGRSLPVTPPDSSLSAWALHTRAPILVEDATREPRLHRNARLRTGITAGLVVPLVVRERAVGVAFIVEQKGPRRFSPSEVERVSAITNQLALALEQARLIEDLRKRNEELAHTQEQLVRRERLAALGEMSAAVAHEVRNPLGAIFNSVASIRRMMDPSHVALPLVDIVSEEADRLNHIVDDLLDFARPSSPASAPVPLPRLLEDAVRRAMTDASGRITVEWALEAHVPRVVADERMMRQAFLNLALNAVQAMPQGGTLRVGARRAQGSLSEVQVEFTDTGSGIPPEVRARIFEPFFTTKAKGTGLGLALVKRILESHAGRLMLESQPGLGTTFLLFLPCEAEPALPAVAS